MEILTILVWPATLCFIAYCVYATYATAQEKKANQLNAEIARLRNQLSTKYDENISNCYEKIDSLETYIANLEAKITVIQNGLQWNKK